MINPIVPAYFGSTELLIQQLLQDPFLGSGQGGKLHKVAERTDVPLMAENIQEIKPSPDPWLPAIQYLLHHIALKELAYGMKDEKLKTNIVAASNRAVTEFGDFVCGSNFLPPGYVAWRLGLVGLWAKPLPLPGDDPDHWPKRSDAAQRISSALTLVAHTYPAGSMREAVLEVARQLIEKDYAVSRKELSSSQAAIPR
jgi:hypothetical protein